VKELAAGAIFVTVAGAVAQAAQGVMPTTLSVRDLYTRLAAWGAIGVVAAIGRASATIVYSRAQVELGRVFAGMALAVVGAVTAGAFLSETTWAVGVQVGTGLLAAFSAQELAGAVLRVARDVRTDPGALLSSGGRWRKLVVALLSRDEPSPPPTE